MRGQEGIKRGSEDKRTGADEIIDCWASSGYSVEGCASLETALRTCMDAPVRTITTYLHPLKWWRRSEWEDGYGRTGGWGHRLMRSTETDKRQEEHHQLPLVENVPTDGWTAQEEVEGRLVGLGDNVRIENCIKSTSCIQNAEKDATYD